MFKWIKEILSYGSGEFSGNGALPPIRTPPLPMPKVKPAKWSNIVETKQEYIVNFIKFLEEKHMHIMDISGRHDRFVIGENNPLDFTEIVTLINEWEKETVDT